MKMLFKSIKILFCAGLTAFAAVAQEKPRSINESDRNLGTEIAASVLVAEFPANTFLENIVAERRTGDLFVTSHLEGKIYRVNRASGAKTEFARINGKPAGIVFDRRGDLLVTGWSASGEPSVYRINRSGTIEAQTVIKEAVFLNGIAHLKDARFLIADSYRGLIWEFDGKEKTYRIWLSDDRLARGDEKNPTPGVNGLKIVGKWLYATNTERQLLLRVAIDKNGGAAGKPQIITEKINGDDFALDEEGNFYVTTHIYNSVVRVSPDGSRKTIIAGEREGAIGSTAITFGTKRGDRSAVYFVTNGGISQPPKEGVQPAKIVRLAVGGESSRK